MPFAAGNVIVTFEASQHMSLTSCSSHRCWLSMCGCPCSACISGQSSIRWRWNVDRPTSRRDDDGVAPTLDPFAPTSSRRGDLASPFFQLAELRPSAARCWCRRAEAACKFDLLIWPALSVSTARTILHASLWLVESEWLIGR